MPSTVLPIGVMPAVVNSNNGTTNHLITFVDPPAADGDLQYVALGMQATTQATEITNDRSMTRVGMAFVANDAAVRYHGVWTLPVPSEALMPATVQFGDTTAGARKVSVTTLLRGVDTAAPVNGSSSTYGTLAGNTITAAAVTPTADGKALCSFAAGWSSPQSDVVASVTAGWTLVGSAIEPVGGTTAVSRNTMHVYSKDVVAGVSTGTCVLTYTGTPAQGTGQMVVFKGNAASPVGAPAWTINSWLAREQQPAWAHRGAPNSTTRSEFSFDAYDKAIAAGFVALEVSAHRTSDGVWVCNHNATTGAQYTTDLTIASNTLATLQALTRRYGVTTEPMRTLHEVLDRYSGYVMFIENKTYNNFTEFFAILDAKPNAFTRFVYKSYYDSTSSMTLAHGKGYKTWGYFFGDADAANLPTYWGTHMDWVGLSVAPLSTSQTWFDWCATRSIPVYTHIATTAADWTTARGQGAHGMTLNSVGLIPLPSAPTSATFIGKSVNATSGPTARTITPHASTLNGDLLIVVGVGTTGGTLSDPASGWTVIKSNITTGTLNTAAWARVRTAGDTTYTFPVSASNTTTHLCLTFRNWDGNLANLLAGTTGTRGAVSSTDTTAPSLTTASADNLVLIIGGERTTATETGITSVTNGFTLVDFEPQTSPGLETIYVGSKTIASASAVGATTITYPNPVANNGMAFLLAIPPTAAVTPTTGFAWFNSVEQTAIRAGWSVANATTVRAVVSTNVGLTSPVYSAVATPSASGWVTARVGGLTPGTMYYVGIEANGTLLSTGRLQGRTMMAVQRSFKFLTGSCQYTGSNHAVFDTMRLENADFLLHQGDIHYADTGVEATWRAAFTSSMTSPKFSALVATLPMPYTWDNHDWAGQGNEADDWSDTVNPQNFIRELAGEFANTTTQEIYKTWVNGRVRFIQTDQWSERDPDEMTESASKRCMSDAQEQWLYATLTAATEPIIVWATLWPLYRSTAGGRWGSYTTQRNRIKAWLAARPAILARLVGMGGDSHSVSSDSGVNQDALGAFPTLNASPFNQAGGLPTGTWNIVNFDSVDASGYYARVTITDAGTSVTLLWEAVDHSSTVVGTYSKTFPATPATGWPVLIATTGAPITASMWVWDGVKLVAPTNVFAAP